MMRVSTPGWSQARRGHIYPCHQVPYLSSEGEGWVFYFLLQQELGAVSREVACGAGQPVEFCFPFCVLGLGLRTVLYCCFCCFTTKGLYRLLWEKELSAWSQKTSF